MPPIWLDENHAYTGKTNPILKNSDFELFLALDDAGNPVGRTITYIDHTFNRYYNAKIGFFGAFECRDDPAAAQLLIEASERWLRERGMESHSRTDPSGCGKLGARVRGVRYAARLYVPVESGILPCVFHRSADTKKRKGSPRL